MKRLVLDVDEEAIFDLLYEEDTQDIVRIVSGLGEDPSTFFENGRWENIDFRSSDLRNVSFRGAILLSPILFEDQLELMHRSGPALLEFPQISSREDATDQENEVQDNNKQEEVAQEEMAYSIALSKIIEAEDKKHYSLNLDIHGLKSIPGAISRLSALQELTVGWQVTDLTPLTELTSLRMLHFVGGQITDLSPLAVLTTLKGLDVSQTWVTDLSPLAGLYSLQRLDLRGSRIRDLSPLAGLTKLQELDLMGTRVTDLTPLAGLDELRMLDLRMTRIRDLSPIAGRTDLIVYGVDGTRTR